MTLPAVNDDDVFEELRKAAAAGDACPSNRGLGRTLGVSEYVIRRSIIRLAAAGRIVVTHTTAANRRKIGIRGGGETSESSPKSKFTQPCIRYVPPMRMTKDPWEGFGDCFANNVRIR